MPVLQPLSSSFPRESPLAATALQLSSANMGAIQAPSPPMASMPSISPAAQATATPVLARLSPSPSSSPRPSPPVSPVMPPGPPLSAIPTRSAPTPTVSPSKPIPISPVPSRSLSATGRSSPVASSGAATRSKPTRGPFCEAAPILCSPESADPLRYCMLLEDRQRHHRLTPSPPPPAPPIPPFSSILPVLSAESHTGFSTPCPISPLSTPLCPVPDRNSSLSPPPRSCSVSPSRSSSTLPRLDIARSAIRENETPILPSPILPFTSRNVDSPRRRSSLLRIAHVVRSESCSPTLSPSTTETDVSRPESPLSSPLEPTSVTRPGSESIRNRFPVMTTSSPSKFVGSYEESLLSRRLSARRSKPIMFNATIGVIGHGKCKPALRCPPHMTVTFSAHYYNFEDDDLLGGGSPVPASSFGPSPPSPTHASHQAVPSGLRPALGWFAAPGTGSITAPTHSPTLPASAPTWTPYVGVIDLSMLKTSSSSDAFPVTTDADEALVCPPKPNKEGVIGGYRIPPRGQLQIVIKNPHQSALKVFLVPYDLSKMPKGTKTAMRHKQYARPVDGQPQPLPDSACPSDTPPTPRKRALSHRSLRYALHIPIVCTPRGRHYLAGSGGLRVVFSGKSPESHERLDAVTELAGGFTPWVPSTSSTATVTSKPVSCSVASPQLHAAASEETPSPYVPSTCTSEPSQPHVHTSPPFIR